MSITSQEINHNNKSEEVEMPIGAFTNCSISPTCGLASEKSIIIEWIDNPLSFYEPSRVEAQINVSQQQSISVKLGVKDNATYIGELNLFGRKFGNYKQDIIMNFEYSEK